MVEDMMARQDLLRDFNLNKPENSCGFTNMLYDLIFPILVLLNQVFYSGISHQVGKNLTVESNIIFEVL
jgi:hypothetical protein